MPAKVDNLDAALLLEKRREQNRAAQKRFREKRAAKQQQQQQQQSREETEHNLASSYDTQIDGKESTPAPWADAVPSLPTSHETGPWAQPPKLQSRQSQTSSSSDTSPFHVLGYQSDLDLSSGTSSSGRSWSSPSTEDITPSPSAANGEAQPATFETTAAQLDLFGLNLPSPQQTSQDDTSPDVEVVQYNGDLETMRDIGLFGGDESWVRPPAPSPTPLLPSSSSQPFDLARLLTNNTAGAQGSFSNSSNSTSADYNVHPSASTSYDNAQANMVPLDFAWTLAQLMSKAQGMQFPNDAIQMGQFSPASMRSIICPDPTMDSRMRVKPIGFASAMRVNLITLGYLVDDGERCDTNVVATLWKKRSAKYTRRGPNGRYAENVEDPNGKLVLSFPDVPTEMSLQPYCGTIPKCLSRADQVRRVQRLRKAPNIHPTKLQLDVPHSIFIDVLPWPSVRDQLIRLSSSGKLDIHDVKGDLVGKEFSHMGAGNTVQIHGDDPLDEEAWELSEYFLQKYHSCVHFDRKIIRRTNFWRRMRGESDVVLEKGSEDSKPNAEEVGLEMPSKSTETQSQRYRTTCPDKRGMAAMAAASTRDSAAAPSMSLPPICYDLETTLEELLASQAGSNASVAM